MAAKVAKVCGSREERRAYWQSHIEVWKRSGLNKQAYCREQGLNRASFQRWYAKLSRTPKDRPRMIPVRIAPVAASGPVAELTLGNGRILRLGGSVEPEWVARLVASLEAGC